MTQFAIPPISDELALCLRAFATLADSAAKSPKRKLPKSPLPASPWAIIFDTETRTDAGQSLRFGTYQVRHDGELREAGIFYVPDGVSTDEYAMLRHYANTHNVTLISREEFVDHIFFGIGWQMRATIIGFNLPFDISRLAIKHGSARTQMRGGFSFTLSSQKIYPHVQIKHLSQRAAFIRFAATMRKAEGRGMRNRDFKIPQREGHFVDVKTLAGALFERSFSLATLSAFLKVEHPKLEFDDFDAPITDEMITYAMGDVQTTWECYAELIKHLQKLELPNLVPEKVYSAASIGKAYLKAMNIMPWRRAQPDFPDEMMGNIMGSYYGGRSEIRIRREVRQVILCDFLSMYPTVCTLMGLWKFVIANGMTWRHSTTETKSLLETIDVGALQSPDIWQQLTTLVRVLPDGDIFPVRAAYMEEPQSTIGLNHLTSNQELWFTLADCIATKIQMGKAPHVVEAISFVPSTVQPGLHAVNISGNAAYRVDPTESDFFKRVIELRQSVKKQRDSAADNERDALDTEQNALKIAANSTAYGVYVEVNVVKRGNPADIRVYSATGAPFNFAAVKVEETGPYFHPLLASLITGAARLMLAITERLVTEQGLSWSFCDTDSMAIAKPGDMERQDFEERVRDIVSWFEALNPYDFGGSILKVEDVNDGLVTGKPEPLYCWAVSAKRYALFNLDAKRMPIMRKVSAHGLGHLRSPYEENHAPSKIPTPDKSVLKDGIKRWHHDLWHQIVMAALHGDPDQVRLNYHASLHRPAISRYGATSPELLNWFKTYNLGKSYRHQVKPFGFLLSLSAKLNWGKERLIFSTTKARRSKSHEIKPITTFDLDYVKAVAKAFDRDTGDGVPASALKTYAEALSSYHLQPESKFLNGDYFDRGMTQRRHVRMISTQHIGKESNDWERQAILGYDPDAAPDYGFAPQDTQSMIGDIAAFVDSHTMTRAAKYLKTSAQKLRGLVTGTGERSGDALAKLLHGRLGEARERAGHVQSQRQAELQELHDSVERDGLRETARRLGVDPSNLRRKIESGL